MNFHVVIPARYASTRIPGKPLRELAGQPMIQHVYVCAQKSGATDVVVATDDARIAETVEGFGGVAVMTSSHHHCGTERLAEAVSRRGYSSDSVVVNLQGDEPLMPPALVHQVANALADRADASIATLSQRITTTGELFDPHVVKVVTDRQGYALYFSRAAIPWDRDAFAVSTEELPARSFHFRHLGLYAYRCGFLADYVRWPTCPLEEMESLEQLRALWHGYQIFVAEARAACPPGVDTEADLTRVARALANAQ